MAKKEKKKSVVFKILIVSILVISCIIGVGIYNNITNRDGNSRVSNDVAQKDINGRYLNIINDTNQIINEVRLFTTDGTEIKRGYQHNPDEKNFSIKIPKSYEEYDEFYVTIIDRYGIKYEKQISSVKIKGLTPVKISENDYVKQDGDWKKKLDRFFNN